MKFVAEIPYRNYWSTPFCKWQGSFSSLNSIEFAAWVTKNELAKRDLCVTAFDHCVLGTTIPQKHAFYGAPWLSASLGANTITGPTISQACATGTRVILSAAQEIQQGLAECALLITADRCSNGPHLYYPNPSAPGGTGDHENWVMDNFNCDPVGHHAMLATAENIAKKYNISTAQQHDIVLMRQEQYTMSLAADNAFQKRFMTLPFDVPKANYKKTHLRIDGDEGVFTSSKQGLDKLRPVFAEGTVTFGAQTHPADGNAGMVLTTPEKAQALSKDPNIKIQLLSVGSARVELAHMPEATIPATQHALKNADLNINDINVIKSHNPFAVNDIVFAQQMGIALEKMNNFGSSLIWGHPQGPTAMRAVIEMIEELVIRGGGLGLFQGCAAGDTAMALVLSVSSRT